MTESHDGGRGSEEARKEHDREAGRRERMGERGMTRSWEGGRGWVNGVQQRAGME